MPASAHLGGGGGSALSLPTWVGSTVTAHMGAPGGGGGSGLSLPAACLLARSETGSSQSQEPVSSGWDPAKLPIRPSHFGGMGGARAGAGGGKGQNFFAYCGRCVWIWTRVLTNFFLVYGIPNPWRGPRSKLRVPAASAPIWPLAGEDLVG